MRSDRANICLTLIDSIRQVPAGLSAIVVASNLGVYKPLLDVRSQIILVEDASNPRMEIGYSNSSCLLLSDPCINTVSI